MSCHNCGEQNDCGCTQESLHISQVCNPIECPIDECSESFSAACSIYTGADIICNNVVVVTTGTNVAQAIANLTAYFCARTTVTADILCGLEVIVTEGTTIEQALIDVTAWFCEAFSSIPARNKYVKETSFPDVDTLDTFILNTEYLPCLLASGYCGSATPSVADIVVTGYWFDSVAGYWKLFTHKDKSEVAIDNAGNIVVTAAITGGTYPINARIIITN